MVQYTAKESIFDDSKYIYMILQYKKLYNNYELIDKWTTSMKIIKIINHVSIPYHFISHIWKIFNILSLSPFIPLSFNTRK